MNSIITSSLSMLEETRVIKFLHQKYSLPKEQLSKFAVGLAGVLCFTPQGAQFCTFFVGTAYPLFISCSVLDPTNEIVRAESDLHKYWVVWIVVTRFEIALASITAFIPMLHQLKLLGYIFNMYNSFSITNQIFEVAIIPTYEYCNLQIKSLETNLEEKNH